MVRSHLELSTEAWMQAIDLTHPLVDGLISWPGEQAFRRHRLFEGETSSGWYSTCSFSSSEHAGTHIDPPAHFHQRGESIDQIKISQFMGNAVCVDATEQVSQHPNYGIGAETLMEWEAANGVIEQGSIVLLRTGWSRHWGDWVRYFGALTLDDPRSLNFPGIDPRAAALLASRGVAMAGIDSPSMDPGSSQDFAAHRALAAAGIPCLVNGASFDRLPATGFFVIALPIQIASASGAPCRAIALPLSGRESWAPTKA